MSDLTLIIGTKAWSSWSLRPWLALKHTSAPFTEIEIPLRTDQTAQRIAALSPSGRVPVLRHGSVVVWDSLAICEYLAETFPAAQLWPSDAEARATARAASAEMHAGFVSLRNTMPMDLVHHHPNEGQVAETIADIARITTLWRECRTRFGQAGPFLFGMFSNADCMYAPVVTRFATYGVDLDPVCRAYADAVLNLPALVEWTAAANRS